MNRFNDVYRRIIVEQTIANDEQTKIVDLGLPDTDSVAWTIIDSVFGQLSDGKWENSPRMEGWWRFAREEKQGGKLVLSISKRSGEKGYWNGKFIPNPWLKLSDDEVKKKLAYFMKQVVKDEYPNGWNRTNQAVTDYLSKDYSNPIKVSDVYRVYDFLMGRRAYYYGE